MKINRTQLQQLIAETVQEVQSVLLETPEAPIVGQEQEGNYTKNPDEYEGELAKRTLYHLSSQAQQLHDMLADGENLVPAIQKKITEAAKSLEEAFKAITYDKQNPRGR
jgi:hypothetical protein